VRTFEKVRRIYRLFDSEKKGTSADVALNISPGPHKDTQELNTHEFRWFNHYLKHDDSPIDSRAPKYFEPDQLKVFGKLPDDQINTKIHETFVAKAAAPLVPTNPASWDKLSNEWLKAIGQRSFRDAELRFTTSSVGADPFGPRNAVQLGSYDRDGFRLS